MFVAVVGGSVVGFGVSERKLVAVIGVVAFVAVVSVIVIVVVVVVAAVNVPTDSGTNILLFILFFSRSHSRTSLLVLSHLPILLTH